MIAIPFVFFLFLLLHYWKKRGFLSLSTPLLGVYTITSFFAIVIDWTDAYSGICPEIEIEIISPILYCLLLYITMLPFLGVKDYQIQRVTGLRTDKLFDYVVYFYFAAFIIVALLTYSDLIRNMILLGANENLKAEFRFGNEEIVSLKGFPLFIYRRLRFFLDSSNFLLFLFFYSLAFMKKSKMFYIVAFLASMSCIYIAILCIERSAVIYWFMTFILCLFFFYRFLNDNQKKGIRYLCFFAAACILSYILYINVARFSNSDNTAGDYMISYAGQSYINFCTFIQRLNLPSYTTIHVFPYLNHLIDPTYRGEDWHLYIQYNTGIFIMCFSTFIGEFISNMGVLNTAIWCVAFSIICRQLLKRKRNDVITPSKLFLLFALVCMPYLGIMASFYHVYAREIGALMFYVIFRLSERKR